MRDTKNSGYQRRKLRLEVANRHKDREISKEVRENLMERLENGETEFVWRVLYDDGFKLRPEEVEKREKVKPDPLNLSWDEVAALELAVEDSIEYGKHPEERYKNLESILDKARNARQ